MFWINEYVFKTEFNRKPISVHYWINEDVLTFYGESLQKYCSGENDQEHRSQNKINQGIIYSHTHTYTTCRYKRFTLPHYKAGLLTTLHIPGIEKGEVSGTEKGREWVAKDRPQAGS